MIRRPPRSTLSLHDALPISRSLSTNLGSLDSLNCSILCGRRPCARQMRWTALTLMPDAFAIIAPVQWVDDGESVRHQQIGRAPSELQSHLNLVCRLLLEKKK